MNNIIIADNSYSARAIVAGALAAYICAPFAHFRLCLQTPSNDYNSIGPRAIEEGSKLLRRVASAVILAVLCVAPARAQLRPVPQDEGTNGLALALRHLPTSGSILYVTAHPDDENNGVLVQLNRGRGLDTALLTLTRGDGGQNEIGPELFQALGILRTEELAAIHRYDGGAQSFTGAC